MFGIIYVTVNKVLGKSLKLVCKRRYKYHLFDTSACRPILNLDNSASRTVTHITSKLSSKRHS